MHERTNADHVVTQYSFHQEGGSTSSLHNEVGETAGVLTCEQSSRHRRLLPAVQVACLGMLSSSCGCCMPVGAAGAQVGGLALRTGPHDVAEEAHKSLRDREHWTHEHAQPATFFRLPKRCESLSGCVPPPTQSLRLCTAAQPANRAH